jgi:hypothetical protein
MSPVDTHATNPVVEHWAINHYTTPETIYQVMRYLTQEETTLVEIQPELDQYLRHVMGCSLSGDREFKSPPFQPPNNDEALCQIDLPIPPPIIPTPDQCEIGSDTITDSSADGQRPEPIDQTNRKNNDDNSGSNLRTPIRTPPPPHPFSPLTLSVPRTS